MAFQLFVVLSALFAVTLATVSGDFGSVGVQTENTVRGAFNTFSSYSKSINTPHSQAYVSRSDYTNNPGIIAHPFAAVAAAPIVAAPHYAAPAYAHAGYAAPIVAHAGYAAPAFAAPAYAHAAYAAPAYAAYK